MGWRQSQSSLQASIHREVDFVSPRHESQTISTLHLAFVCFFLYPGSSDSCTKDSGILGWDCYPEKPALCYWKQRGWSGRMKGTKRASVKGLRLSSMAMGSWEPGPQLPPLLAAWHPLDKQPQWCVYQYGRWQRSRGSGRDKKNTGSTGTCQENLGSNTDLGNASRIKKHNEPELPTQLKRLSLSLLLIGYLYAEDMRDHGV